jgi:hypothetical protein
MTTLVIPFVYKSNEECHCITAINVPQDDCFNAHSNRDSRISQVVRFTAALYSMWRQS